MAKKARREKSVRSLEDIPLLIPWHLSVSASIAAALAAIVSHALDIAKTRSQATVISKVSANAGIIGGQHVVVDAKRGLDAMTLAFGIRSTVGVSS